MRQLSRKPVPFRLDRASTEGLTDQLVEGLREAIRTGYYASDDVLPSHDAIAAAIGVSEIVARNAVRRLAAEGLVVSRPRLGSVVLPRTTPIWRGHVLCVLSDHDFNRRQAVMVEQIRAVLTQNGFLFSQVGVLHDADGRCVYEGIETALLRPVELIVLMEVQPDIEAWVSKKGVPYVVIGNWHEVGPNCIGQIGQSLHRALQDFIRYCNRHHIKRIDIISCNKCPVVQRELVAGGLKVRTILAAGSSDECVGPRRASSAMKRPFPVSYGIERCEKVMQLGLDFVRSLLASRHRSFPDAYLVTDDYKATGMLTGFPEGSVRLPEDVGFVCCTTGGFCPVYTKPIAQIETTPCKWGEIAAERILRWLLERKPFPNDNLQAVFVPGETLA